MKTKTINLYQERNTFTKNTFTVEINKTVVSANDDKATQPIDSKEMYAFGTRKGLVCKKKESKCNNMIKQYKKTNFDNATKEIIKEHNTNWPQIHDHPY